MSTESRDLDTLPASTTDAQPRPRRRESQSHHAKAPRTQPFLSQFALLIAVFSIADDNIDKQATPILFALLAYAWPHLNQQPLQSSINIVCVRKIYTANDEAETAECLAFEETKGVFSFVGSRDQVMEKYPGTTIRDLQTGMTILPGLYDSHGHIMHVPPLFLSK
jgi:hypothetical protein